MKRVRYQALKIAVSIRYKISSERHMTQILSRHFDQRLLEKYYNEALYKAYSNS